LVVAVVGRHGRSFIGAMVKMVREEDVLLTNDGSKNSVLLIA
jgi:hypothetical protein